jgi:hypothetical protein
VAPNSISFLFAAIAITIVMEDVPSHVPIVGPVFLFVFVIIRLDPSNHCPQILT